MGADRGAFSEDVGVETIKTAVQYNAMQCNTTTLKLPMFPFYLDSRELFIQKMIISVGVVIRGFVLAYLIM